VQRAVELLEDDPRVNSATGGSLTSAGTLELDASIMRGEDLAAGAVCSLPPFAHPIAIARAVLEDGRHVLYAADGAARFAIEKGFERVAAEKMITDAVRERWERGAHKGQAAQGYAGNTVGAVARDARGHVAAATSTGGTFFKREGRVGDTPIVGAGTYADDSAGAASATGIGEAIIRVCLTKTTCEWLRQGMSPEDAARAAVLLLEERGRGHGGLVLVDARGRYGFARTTASMSWAAVSAAGEASGY
jgi:beta-aspartyl-peptidase (threonine type)